MLNTFKGFENTNERNYDYQPLRRELFQSKTSATQERVIQIERRSQFD